MAAIRRRLMKLLPPTQNHASGCRVLDRPKNQIKTFGLKPKEHRRLQRLSPGASDKISIGVMVLMRANKVERPIQYLAPLS
jgi:hypothetical protein